MKFLYEYRTTDNAKHNGVICASNRDAAYAELKKTGVKPSRLVEAPGVFNKLFGKGKRWLTIGVLGSACVVMAVVLLRGSDGGQFDELLDSRLRRQPIGDTALIERGVRTGWESVFAKEGDRFLASFAIPGVPAAVRSTSREAVEEVLFSPATEAPREKLSIEARQIVAMVEGMKDELREFLKDGGRIETYGQRLVRRQDEEIGYYNRAKTELEMAARRGTPKEELEVLWESENEKLRKMGIKLIPHFGP